LLYGGYALDHQLNEHVDLATLFNAVDYRLRHQVGEFSAFGGIQAAHRCFDLYSLQYGMLTGRAAPVNVPNCVHIRLSASAAINEFRHPESFA
jgi:hypothetical protein